MHLIIWTTLSGIKNDLFEKNIFVDFDFRNEISRYYLVTLPIFAMIHPQTTDVQSFKVEHFSTKVLKFQKYDVITYDVSVDLGILFVLLHNSLVMSYPCAKFHHLYRNYLI